ncbi:MAG TPA: hypothetical protein DEA08_06525, partial [Planctomycetes bacterium]|nr:hypothetical protein [Planctomycetota bacterium]
MHPTRTFACAALLSLALPSLALGQSATKAEGQVLRDPLRVFCTSPRALLRAGDMSPGLARALSQPELEGCEVGLLLEGGRVVALEGATRGDVGLLSGTGLGAKRVAEIKANSSVLVTDSKEVGGRLWLRVRAAGQRGVLSADQVEFVRPGAVSGWLGETLAPLFARGTRAKEARFFHPDGHVFKATVTSLSPRDAEFSKVAEELAGQALIRLGSGLQRLKQDGSEPDGDDALSLAIRFTSADHALDTKTRPGDQDLLLTAWLERFTHVATRSPFGDPHDFFNNHYFPGVPFQIAGRPVWLRLVPKAGITKRVGRAALLKRLVGLGKVERKGRERIPALREAIRQDRARFLLQVQRGEWWRVKRPWTNLVELNLVEELPEIDQSALHYHPHLEGAGLKPTGFWTDVRRSVYRASQAEREEMAA